MYTGNSIHAPNLEQAVPLPVAPPSAPVEGSKEWTRLHFARLRIFRQIPLVLRQYSLEECWQIVCAAVQE